MLQHRPRGDKAEPGGQRDPQAGTPRTPIPIPGPWARPPPAPRHRDRTAPPAQPLLPLSPEFGGPGEGGDSHQLPRCRRPLLRQPRGSQGGGAGREPGARSCPARWSGPAAAAPGQGWESLRHLPEVTGDPQTPPRGRGGGCQSLIYRNALGNRGEGGFGGVPSLSPVSRAAIVERLEGSGRGSQRRGRGQSGPGQLGRAPGRAEPPDEAAPGASSPPGSSRERVAAAPAGTGPGSSSLPSLPAAPGCQISPSLVPNGPGAPRFTESPGPAASERFQPPFLGRTEAGEGPGGLPWGWALGHGLGGAQAMLQNRSAFAAPRGDPSGCPQPWGEQGRPRRAFLQV